MMKSGIPTLLAGAALALALAGSAQAQQRGSVLQPPQSRLGGGGIAGGIANRPSPIGGGFAVKPGAGLVGTDGGSLMGRNGSGLIARDGGGFRR